MPKRNNPKPGLIPSGTTAFYNMIGTPVRQVVSPACFNRFFAEKGIDAVMVAMDVPPGQVVAHFEHMRSVANFRGSIVTVPHKGAAAGCAEELSPRARDLGAVNVVRLEKGRLIGDMVDGIGFLAALSARGFSAPGKRVAVIGGGAAGAAIAYAMAGAGARHIAVREIEPGRRSFIEKLLRKAHPEAEVSLHLDSLQGFDLVVNATPVGMNADPNLPFPVDSLSPPTMVADVITKPAMTPWLEVGRNKGCEILQGTEMVLGQIGLMGRHLGLDITDSDVPSLYPL